MLNMNIDWGDNKLFAKLEEVFLALGKKALTMNHYDLAECTDYDNPQLWKEFLQDERVNKFITTEFNAIQDSELRKLIMNISDSSSVGKAQLINSLQKVLNDHGSDKKSGPAFIYTYIPLTEEEKHADNVKELDHDPFVTEVSSRGSEASE